MILVEQAVRSGLAITQESLSQSPCINVYRAGLISLHSPCDWGPIFLHVGYHTLFVEAILGDFEVSYSF